MFTRFCFWKSNIYSGFCLLYQKIYLSLWCVRSLRFARPQTQNKRVKNIKTGFATYSLFFLCPYTNIFPFAYQCTRPPCFVLYRLEITPCSFRVWTQFLNVILNVISQNPRNPTYRFFSPVSCFGVLVWVLVLLWWSYRLPAFPPVVSPCRCSLFPVPVLVSCRCSGRVFVCSSSFDRFSTHPFL